MNTLFYDIAAADPIDDHLFDSTVCHIRDTMRRLGRDAALRELLTAREDRRRTHAVEQHEVERRRVKQLAYDGQIAQPAK